MWQSVFDMDAATLTAVAVKALAYFASLSAAGSALVLAWLSAFDDDIRRMVRRLGLAGALVAAGAGMLVLLTGNPLDALATEYGRLLAVKLALFLLLLGLAAFNKLRLTPALLADDAGAGIRLRRSIRLELAVVAAILATTAILTTIASPDTEG